MAVNRPGKRVNSLINSIAGNAARGNMSRRNGRVTSVGKSTCDVLFDGDTKPTPGVKFTGAAPRVGTRLEVRDLAGRNEAITSASKGGSRSAGLVINNNIIGGGGGSSLSYPLPHASSHAAGGGDPLTPADIGAATPANITTALNTHTSDSDPHSQYLLTSGTRAMVGTLSTQHLLPVSPDTYDIGSSLLMYRKGFVSEMDAFIHALNTVSIHQGYDLVVKDSGVLTFPIAAADTTYDFGKAMTPNDFILFRGLGAVEYMQIGAVVTGTEYNITRNLDGSGANDWPSGAVYAVLGYNGTGRIEFSAATTPRLSIIRQGTSYNAQTEVLRLGDLNGVFGIASELYGLGVGDYAGGNYLEYDPTNGFTMRAGGANVGIDSNGITLLAKSSRYDPNSLKFLSAFTGSNLLDISAKTGGMGASYYGNISAGRAYSTPIVGEAGHGGYMQIGALGSDSSANLTQSYVSMVGGNFISDYPHIELYVYDSGVDSDHSARSSTVTVHSDGLDIQHGLNVGTATGATAGQIKASASITGTDGNFSGGLNVGSATGAGTGDIKTSDDVVVGGNLQLIGQHYIQVPSNHGLNFRTLADEVPVTSFRGATTYGHRVDIYNAGDSVVGVSLKGTASTFTGSVSVGGGFGCNGANPQTAYASGGALAAYGAGANGFDTAAHASALYAMVVAMRAALVANGTMS